LFVMNTRLEQCCEHNGILKSYLILNALVNLVSLSPHDNFLLCKVILE
jgi:hypothetical protein